MTPAQRRDEPAFPWMAMNAPWWAQMSLFILAWFGPSIIVAGVFLGMWTGWLPSPVTENTKILVRVESKLDTSTIRMVEEVNSSHEHDESVIRLLLATCRNVAKNDVERTQCENYWRR